MIKSQIIKGTRLTKLRTTALEEHQLTLYQLLPKGRAYERAELQKTLIEEKSDAVAVNRLNNGQKWFRQQNQPNQNQSSKNQASNQKRSHQQGQQFQSQPRQYGEEESLEEECDNCGFQSHRFGRCPARNLMCYKCDKRGHYARCCDATSNEDGRSIQGPQPRKVQFKEPETSSDSETSDIRLNKLIK